VIGRGRFTLPASPSLYGHSPKCDPTGERMAMDGNFAAQAGGSGGKSPSKAITSARCAIPYWNTLPSLQEAVERFFWPCTTNITGPATQRRPGWPAL
jgi:hypothetical protein